MYVGVPWSEEEHRSFLAGLEELGKGDWRGISRKFVITRTPTQVASHAQKYFLRQSSSLDGRKRRTSLFDAVNISFSSFKFINELCSESIQTQSELFGFRSQSAKRHARKLFLPIPNQNGTNLLPLISTHRVKNKK